MTGTQEEVLDLVLVVWPGSKTNLMHFFIVGLFRAFLLLLETTPTGDYTMSCVCSTWLSILGLFCVERAKLMILIASSIKLALF